MTIEELSVVAFELLVKVAIEYTEKCRSENVSDEARTGAFVGALLAFTTAIAKGSGTRRKDFNRLVTYVVQNTYQGK